MNILELRSIDSRLKEDFTNKRRAAIEAAEQRRSRLLAVPEYVKIDRICREITLSLSKETSTQKATALKNSLSLAERAKKDLFAKLGCRASDFEPKFECKKCGDTGLVNGRPCECFIRAKRQKALDTLGLESKFLEGFDNISLSNIKDQKQAEQILKLQTILNDWADKFPNTNKRNIVICGTTGVGKTFIAKCLAGKLVARGLDVCFLSAFELNELMLKYHSTFDATKNLYLDTITKCDVLIVDDLGTEPIFKNVTENYLTLILSERELNKRASIVTTNLSPNDIFDRYRERVYSRLISKRTGLVFHLTGSDLRISK